MPLLELRHVSKFFGGVAASADVSFSIDPGTVVSLMGPSGAGKTTLFDCISGFHRPDRGEIVFRGKRIHGMPPDRIGRTGLVRARRGSGPSAALPVLEEVLVGALVRTRRLEAARADALEQLRTVGLDAHAGAPAGTLSAGERRRLEVARVLATRPELVLLDEVTDGLAPAEAEEIIQLVRARRDAGLTWLLISRDAQTAMRVSDRVVVLQAGEKVAEGPPAEIVQRPEVVRAFLGEAS